MEVVEEADQTSDSGSVVVRGLIRPILGCVGVIVIAEDWPCWLPVLGCLGIPVEVDSSVEIDS
jgi:hypothetical protein